MASFYSLEQWLQKSIGYHSNLQPWILLQNIFYNRNCHRDIAHCRETNDQYMLGLLHLFCLLLVQDWIQHRIVVHLHLFVHFHVLIAPCNICKQFINGS